MKPIILIAVLSFYSGHTLQWSDFKGKAPANRGNEVAAVSWQWQFEIDERDDSTYTFYCTCEMSEEDSWTTTTDNYILNHERGHFALARYQCQQFSIALKKMDHCKDCVVQAQRLYSIWWNENDRIEKQYDNETSHSENRVEQARWNEKINKLK